VKIAAVIPAYNEAKTIGGVIRIVKTIPEIDEVIVVSDGSTDLTADIAREAGATVIQLPKNVGKGGAVKKGIDATDAELFLLLDADLLGLTKDHILSLLKPIIDDQADMTIGLFKSGRFLTDIAQELAPNLSGQRAIKRHVIEPISDIDLSRFGVEIALSTYVKQSGLRVHRVTLPHVSHVMKEEKLGLMMGFSSRIKMYRDIIRYRMIRHHYREK
jgi:glycosyltransferase involved in cell wall biosynthesis